MSKSLDGKVETLVLVLFNRVINYKDDIYWAVVKFTDDANILAIFRNITKFLKQFSVLKAQLITK